VVVVEAVVVIVMCTTSSERAMILKIMIWEWRAKSQSKGEENVQKCPPQVTLSQSLLAISIGLSSGSWIAGSVDVIAFLDP
jgi:hypothetical protein